jgi:hypothetical protein
VLPESAIHDMVMQAILAGSNARPMPDFGPRIHYASAEQLARLNKGYEGARNHAANRRRSSKR